MVQLILDNMKDEIRLEQHMNNGKVEYVMCSAIWIDDGIDYYYQPYNIDKGLVYCGHRHSCIIQQIPSEIKKQFHGIQGFLTTKNRFLTREEALELVKENGQLPSGKIIGGVLTSEDLW